MDFGVWPGAAVLLRVTRLPDSPDGSGGGGGVSSADGLVTAWAFWAAPNPRDMAWVTVCVCHVGVCDCFSVFSLRVVADVKARHEDWWLSYM